MDFELMLNSLPKLLSATVITLKLLSVSLIIGMFLFLAHLLLPSSIIERWLIELILFKIRLSVCLLFWFLIVHQFFQCKNL